MYSTIVRSDHAAATEPEVDTRKALLIGNSLTRTYSGDGIASYYPWRVFTPMDITTAPGTDGIESGTVQCDACIIMFTVTDCPRSCTNILIRRHNYDVKKMVWHESIRRARIWLITTATLFLWTIFLDDCMTALLALQSAVMVFGYTCSESIQECRHLTQGRD